MIVHPDDENLPPLLRGFADNFMDTFDLGAGGIGYHSAAIGQSVILSPGDTVGADDYTISS